MVFAPSFKMLPLEFCKYNNFASFSSFTAYSVLPLVTFLSSYIQEPFNLQLKVFMNEVSQQSLIPVIRR